MKYLALVFIILAAIGSQAQRLERTYVCEAVGDTGSWITVWPAGKNVQATLILLPAFGEMADSALKHTAIASVASKHGIAVIIPCLPTDNFGIDSATQHKLSFIIKAAFKKSGLPAKPVYIGGFSMGGSAAVKYAALAATDTSRLKPTAVFGIDPPLDFERFYDASVRSIRLAGNATPPQEPVYMSARMVKEMKGTPGTALHAYRAMTPYSYSDTSGAAVKLLKSTPLLLITEPDVTWWMDNRGADFTGMNSTDCAAMINELQRAGNSNAVLKTTMGKGFREPGHIRHPHSWSIADPDELINWLLKYH